VKRREDAGFALFEQVGQEKAGAWHFASFRPESAEEPRIFFPAVDQEHPTRSECRNRDDKIIGPA
jgi:hypothetical protein